MSKYTQKDHQLLTEAYNLQLLKEQSPNMTIKQLQNKMLTMSEGELKYINTVNERILNEFFGGLKNVGQAAKNVVGGAFNAGKNMVGNAVNGAVQSGKNAVGNATNAVKSAGQGVLAAGKQIVDNTKDMYNTGEADATQSKAIDQAQQSMQQLIDLVTQAQSKGLIKLSGEITNMSLAQIIDQLTKAKSSTQISNQQAMSKGLTGGIKQAASQAYKTGRQQS